MLLILSIVLFSLILHEYAHGWIASLCGDTTARQAGRLQFTPRTHIDLVGTILVPLSCLALRLPAVGWVKPIPVNQYNLRNPRHDTVMIALAGPCANLALACLLSLINRLLPFSFFNVIISYAGYINVVLALCMFMPVPLLDGWDILKAWVPYPYSKRLEDAERFRIPILAGLLICGLFNRIVLPVSNTITGILGFQRLF